MSAGPLRSREARKAHVLGPLRSREGVTDITCNLFASVGINPEQGSPMHDMMVLYDNIAYRGDAIHLLEVARKIHALTPLASCRYDDPLPPTG